MKFSLKELYHWNHCLLAYLEVRYALVWLLVDIYSAMKLAICLSELPPSYVASLAFCIHFADFVLYSSFYPCPLLYSHAHAPRALRILCYGGLVCPKWDSHKRNTTNNCLQGRVPPTVGNKATYMYIREFKSEQLSLF